MEKVSCKRRYFSLFVLLAFCAILIVGCADKDPIGIQYNKLAEFSDRRGQANVKLYMYSGDAKLDDIKEYTNKLGCNMLYAYFYPDSTSLNDIPVEDIRSAKSFSRTQDVLFNGEGFTGWRFASRCFAVIPIVTDCKESPVKQNCR